MFYPDTVSYYYQRKQFLHPCPHKSKFLDLNSCKTQFTQVSARTLMR